MRSIRNIIKTQLNKLVISEVYDKMQEDVTVYNGVILARCDGYKIIDLVDSVFKISCDSCGPLMKKTVYDLDEFNELYSNMTKEMVITLGELDTIILQSIDDPTANIIINIKRKVIIFNKLS